MKTVEREKFKVRYTTDDVMFSYLARVHGLPIDVELTSVW